MRPFSRQFFPGLRIFSLRQRLGLGIAALVLPLLLLTFTGYLLFHYAIELMDESYREVDEEFIPVTTLQETLLRAVMPPNDYLIHGNTDERLRFQVLRTEVDEGFERALAVQFQVPRKHTYVVKAQSLWNEAARISEEILALEHPQGDASGAELMERMDARVDEVYEHLETVCSATVSELESKHAILHRMYAKLGIAIVGFVVLISAVVLIGSMLVKRWVIAPLDNLQSGAREFAEGRLDYRIPVESDDEIGNVARTFNEMAAALKRDRDILRNLSIHDQLTGLLNRKEFQRLLDLEIARSQRHGRMLALLMIDVDYFKTVNDRYGHPAGDIVLRHVADRIFSSLRPNDVVARYGGEEFIVMLPETDNDGAIAIAERLCQQMRSAPMDVAPGIQPVVTVSAGIAVYPLDSDVVEKLIELADQALYAAKAAGRNRYCRYADLQKSSDVF